MKFIDRYVLGFVAAMALYTILFRSLLSGSLDQHHYQIIWLYSIVYAVAIAITGWVLGVAHSQGNFLFDLGLPFGIGGFLAWGTVSVFWFKLGFSSPVESISGVYLGLYIWGFILAAQFIVFLLLRKQTIRGMLKSGIFS